jgi:AcrR family transcriptional regulator
VGNRDALLEAAIECLHDRGYARTTARDLVARSGTSLGAIGYHFGSKEKLLNEAIHTAFHEWVDPLIAIASEPGEASPLERLREGFGVLLDSLEEHRGVVVSLFEAIAAAERSDDLREQLAACYDELRDAIGAVISSAVGLPDGDDGGMPTLMASVLVAVFDGMLVQWLLDPERTPTGEELDRALDDALATVAVAAQARSAA